ncbi:HXXEE domain-containing protein [Bacillus sonorensis]|uniref:HXXEE domain-containing protein n=1 Tax=Bacillus sonorensis TaxID=119858 RepID=UPI002DBF046F|nr:HXXEE domain-containing protein [Bacillus sonorensis]MEC1503921.1 HXXEE domain-containing protein [Bacillus sonorensis]
MEVLVILFLFSITLHNLEEVLWLPAWLKQAGKFQKPAGKNEFYFAVVCITSLAYLTAFFYLFFLDAILAKYILIGFLGAMVLNAIFPHLLASIILKTYAPGVLTGVLLNIPINSFILYRFFQERSITIKELLLSTLIVSAILLSLIPLLFKIGKTAAKRF